MKRLFLIIPLLLISISVCAQEFDILFQQCYGGSGGDVLWDVYKKAEGGYYVFASSTSSDGDLPFNYGKMDFWLFETDALGQIIWQKIYGGSDSDTPKQFLSLPDGGFLLFGDTFSVDGDVGCNHRPNGATSDLWLVRTDSLGNKLWDRCYGGSHQEFAGKIIHDHEEDCFIIVASTGSDDGDISDHKGSYDAWVLKLDSMGNIIWERTYGGTGQDHGYSICLTSDGGYILGASAGLTAGTVNGDIYCREDLSLDRGYTGWLLKLNKRGEIEWQQCYGETINGIIETADGGYVFIGFTDMDNEDADCFYGYDKKTWDTWLVKTDSRGVIEWQRCLGGTKIDTPKFLKLLDDGTYLIGGESNSKNFDVSCGQSTAGFTGVLYRVSAEGDLLWSQCFSSLFESSIRNIEVISPDHYVLAAKTRGTGNDVNCNYHGGTMDGWLVEIQDTTVSLPEQRQQNIAPGFMLYPNPATLSTWVELPEHDIQAVMQLQLISPTGCTLYEAPAKGRFHQITLESYPAGLYLVRLWDGERWRVQKLMKY